MKRNTLFFVLTLLMIISAAVLFAQEIREEEWGEHWGLFPVKPDEVFSNPKRYWFYDNVDLSDTLKWVIKDTKLELGGPVGIQTTSSLLSRP